METQDANGQDVEQTPSRPSNTPEKRLSRFAFGGSGLAVILFVVGCLGPALVMLGLGGASLWAFLHNNEPYLIAAAVLFATAGIALSLKRRRSKK